ncbi:hypothetical protein [Ruminococcus sp.]|uniref:hypothetical protein n=1 Tax=Ruminococcus sp. TaxID=41978 RepID=UPI002CE366BE|nr:hypothetical protein [Ruminococcus sp.]HNZ98845.1 hypothetical protein [Ruminococcus sp.]HOH86260.1 hypothetical protein [Ruminococcus sp.]
MNFFTDRRCKRCYIQEDEASGIVLDSKGICSLCRQAQKEREPDWLLLKNVFEDTINKYRGIGREYDGVVMMSGGKDSAYLACTLRKKYGLRLIGFINDIHYEYSQTFEGAANICKKLDMPLYVNKFDDDIMRRYFRFLFMSKELRDSGFGHICNYCGRFMIRAAGDFAKEHGVPMVFSGHNPEQVFGMGESFETDPKRIVKRDALRQMIKESVVKARGLSGEQAPDIIDYFPDGALSRGSQGSIHVSVFPLQAHGDDRLYHKGNGLEAHAHHVERVHSLRLQAGSPVDISCLQEQERQLCGQGAVGAGEKGRYQQEDRQGLL